MDVVKVGFAPKSARVYRGVAIARGAVAFLLTDFFVGAIVAPSAAQEHNGLRVPALVLLALLALGFAYGARRSWRKGRRG
jgi:hypothetical protein